MFDIMIQNLLSPVVLFFVLGVIAALVKSDLKFPAGLSEALSIYLLVAIGIKGGMELSHYELSTVIKPIAGTLFLGVTIPVLVLVALLAMKMDLHNSIGLAATYGSVSIVTYGAAISFLEKKNIGYEGFMNALVVLLESPAIIISLLLLRILHKTDSEDLIKAPGTLQKRGMNFSSVMNLFDKEVLRDSLLGKSVLLLMGSLIIGWLVGQNAESIVKPLFIDLYGSILILFLLNMGLIAGERLPEISKHGWKILLFGLCVPLFGGSVGVLVGNLVGLSLGGVLLMAVLAGSSSYIAAPAALRTSVPEANPSIYLGLSLGVTFPFNLIVGIPFYFALAQLTQ
ncbi:MAG: sodium-dependent bicarbonate transport family permease [Planococcus donghaensis]